MQRQRLRAKAACEPCRTRKRKCDGKQPCALCVQYEYDCVYHDHVRKRKGAKLSDQSGPSTDDGLMNYYPHVSRTGSAMTSPEDHERYMEANAGTVFPHILGAKLNSPEAPKIYGIGWNLGLRRLNPPPSSLLCSLISMVDCQTLAGVYFERVHPIYDFVNQSMFEHALLQRWHDMQAPPTDYEPVICGVVALGLLFSGQESVNLEQALVSCAKSYLDDTSIIRQSNTHLAKAWLLRTMYLRMTSSPQSAWMTSCVAMHTLEDAGMHQERGRRSLVYADALEPDEDVDTQRRIFWITCLFNTWISHECGRSRVILRGTNREIPTTRPDDHTADLIKLFKISESIDPETVHETSALERCLLQVEKMNTRHDVVKLSQSNLALALYRRLRTSALSVSSATINMVIRIGCQAIEAAHRLAVLRCPWHHVLNQPFQFLCILLAMDTQESLSCVARTMCTLKNVASVWDTNAARKAVETAQILIRVSRKRKEQEAANLGQLENVVESPRSSSGMAGFEGAFFGDINLSLDNERMNDPEMLNQMINDFDWDSFLSYPDSFIDQLGPSSLMT